MKKILFIIVLFFLFGINLSFGYENQGFIKYQENNGKIDFECQKQCFIVLGQKENNNLLKIKGDFGGNGIIGYGFLNGQQIVPGEFSEIKNNISLNNNFYFNNLQYYNQLSNEIITILVIDGNLKSNNFSFIFNKSSFSENIKYIFNDFLKIETLTPYSINLRYGVMLGGVSIVKIFYIIFVILGLFLIFNKKYRNINNFIILGIILFMFIGFRNLYTYGNILNTGLKNYTFENQENKTFFDLGDYITFTDKIRKKINLDDKDIKKDCKIYIESFQDRPFKAHWESVYLKPCDFTTKIEEVNYLIYYKKQKAENIKGEMLINFNNSYLYLLKK